MKTNFKKKASSGDLWSGTSSFAMKLKSTISYPQGSTKALNGNDKYEIMIEQIPKSKLVSVTNKYLRKNDYKHEILYFKKLKISAKYVKSKNFDLIILSIKN
ncbi:hypothetical protein BpHYR1_004567 [Brachionus plicatilis]|uniref:Uncharacterized protein n=1 Tax=Brachionus plicatilis TaxID=10195 RepID=A0A3M7PSI0_BRAPC|nr:hypothetical protein BpHYR1_004567 [Brachionus plicatilis]